MTAARPRTLAEHMPIVFPAAMLLAFFVVPFSIMIAVSFFRRVPAAFYHPDFVLDSYTRFLTPFFTSILGFSLALSSAVAVIAVAIAFPFTYGLTQLPRRIQVCWLVFMLAILSLSEVIIGFSWATLLSRSAGLSNLLVAAALLDEPVAWAPSLGAVLVGMVYQAFPYSVLVLYPSLARLDPEIVEASRTLGASPVRAFFTVVVPMLRRVLVATFVMVFVFALGSYLLPQLLGRPRHWTLSVHITDQAVYQSNMPFAAAMAVFLVLVSLALVGLALLLERRAA